MASVSLRRLSILLVFFVGVEAQYDPVVNFCKLIDHQCKSSCAGSLLVEDHADVVQLPLFKTLSISMADERFMHSLGAMDLIWVHTSLA